MQQVPELVVFGAEVAFILGAGRHFNRDPLLHLEPVTLQADDLLRIVGQKAHALHAEVHQNLRAQAVIAQKIVECKTIHNVFFILYDEMVFRDGIALHYRFRFGNQHFPIFIFGT